MRSDIFHHTPTFPVADLSYPSLFNELNTISGAVGEITPELMLKLGYACSEVSQRIAIGYSENSVCKLLAYAFMSAAGISGVQITETDTGFFAAASYVARNYLFNLTLFIESTAGKLRIRILDKFGLPISRELQQKISSSVNHLNIVYAGFSSTVMPKSITGTKEALATEIAKRNKILNFRVSLQGQGAAAEALKYALVMSGCEMVPSQKGIVMFDISSDGSGLRIRDENGFWHDDAHIDSLLALVYFLRNGRELAVSATAPSVIEQIASEFGGQILRIGRDHGAKEVFLSQNVLTDAIASAAFLCSYLSEAKKTVYELMEILPTFALVTREISVSSDRHQILSKLTEAADGLHKENTGALRICADGGWVNIIPSHSKNRLKVTAESFNEEIASELCSLFVERTHLIDTEQQK